VKHKKAGNLEGSWHTPLTTYILLSRLTYVILAECYTLVGFILWSASVLFGSMKEFSRNVYIAFRYAFKM
jgi:hypothetical protein